MKGNGHYDGKRRQKQLVEAGPIPWTIQRTTQFFDFAAMVVGWTTNEGVATVPPLLVQPVAVADVAALLAAHAAGAPQRFAPDLAGHERLDFVDMARRTLAARHDPTKLVASWRGTPFGLDMAGEVLLPARARGSVPPRSKPGSRNKQRERKKADDRRRSTDSGHLLHGLEG